MSKQRREILLEDKKRTLKERHQNDKTFHLFFSELLQLVEN